MSTPIPNEYLRELIQHTLQPINLYTPDVEELLMATFANESHCGEYRQQISGPALGIGQCEPNTYHDIWINFLQYHKILYVETIENGLIPPATTLIFDDPLAIKIARIQYLRSPLPIPPATDIEAIWTMYKQVYNAGGKADHDTFIKCHQKYAQ